MDKRIGAVAAQVHKEDHGREVLRVAALLAYASNGISNDERGVLEKLATSFKLAPPDVDVALAEVKAVLAANAA